MPLTYTGLVALGTGAYGDDVTRDDGSQIRWVDLYDAAEGKSLRATLGPNVDPASVPQLGTAVEADVTVGERRNRQGTLTGMKWRVDSLRPARTGSALKAA